MLSADPLWQGLANIGLSGPSNEFFVIGKEAHLPDSLLSGAGVDSSTMTVFDCQGQQFMSFNGALMAPTFRNVVFRNCSHTNGGAIELVHSSANFENCVFESCSAEVSGGAVVVDGQPCTTLHSLAKAALLAKPFCFFCRW